MLLDDREDRSRSECRSRSNSRVSTNRDRIRCYRCREYDHFAIECPNTVTDEELDHSNIEQTALQMLMQETPIDLEGQAQVECLNLWKARMALTHFCQLMTRQVEKSESSKIKTPYV